MPIIINGGSRRAGGWWSKHLTDKEMNTRVELVEMRGLSAETVRDAFTELRAFAIGTKCENYFYQANINPRADEHLTPEQWVQAADTLESNLGLSGQPRFVIEHEKEGRTHRHIVWSRIDMERQRAIPDSLTAQIHERTSRELETAFGLEPGRSVLVPEREFERPERGPAKWELFRGERHGTDARTIGRELTELWNETQSAEAFKAAIEERGYVLARGDRRDFVVLDHTGDVHSLARRIEGAKAADIRARFEGFDRTTLSGVEDAKTMIEAREPSPNIESEAASPNPEPEQSQTSDDGVAATDSDGVDEHPNEAASEDLGGDPVKGIAQVLDGAARLAESTLGMFDLLGGGSSIPQPLPERLMREQQPEPPPQPVGAFPHPDALLDADTRREAILRAIAVMESTLRQERDLRDREAGHENGIERERMS